MEQKIVDIIMGVFKDHKEETNKRFDKIDDKLDDLNSFKLKVVGGGMVLGAIVGIIIRLISH